MQPTPIPNDGAYPVDTPSTHPLFSTRPQGLLGRLRYALAAWISPEQFLSWGFVEAASRIGRQQYEELIDAKAALAATREALSAYRELLEESERQRRIDEDARHDWKSAACAYRLKFEQLQSQLNKSQQNVKAS